jgi:predicted ATP-grasp superfamily ATP-dependent carboligase
MGVQVFCIDHEPDALAMKSRYCAGRFAWDFESSPPDDSAQFLIGVGRKIGQKSILLPTFDTRSLFVEQYRDLLSQWFLFPQPAPGAVPRLYSKESLYRLCKTEDVPTPETLFPDSVEEALREGPGLQFPLIVKAIDPDRLMHRTGRRMAVVHQLSELRDAYAELDEPGIKNLALQEFIPGDTQDTWMLNAYFDRVGDCRFAITGHKLRQLPIDGGVTTLGVCAPSQAMIDSISRVVAATGYQGVVDTDFCYDNRDGLWKLLDVNPRIGATFRLFVDQHGFDVVRALYLDLTGQSLPSVEPFWGRRWLVEDKDLDAMRAHRRKGSLSLGAWLGSLRGVSEFAHFAVDDLWPSAIFAMRLVRKNIRRVFGRLPLPSKQNR